MLEPIFLSETKECIIPGDKEKTIDYCTEHFYMLYQKAIKEKDFFSVALSGGSTPKALFQKLSSYPYNQKIDWKKILFFWSDERNVSPDSDQSNYKMAMEAGLKSYALPSLTFRMHAENQIEKNALLYEKLLQEKLHKKLLDLVMLGMGEDGHIASLFPHTKALTETHRLVVANFIPEKNTYRMTFTFPCINNSQKAVLYVLGKSKQQMIKEILTEEKKLPAFFIGTKKHKALWILDEKAAALSRNNLLKNN